MILTGRYSLIDSKSIALAFLRKRRAQCWGSLRSCASQKYRGFVVSLQSAGAFICVHNIPSYLPQRRRAAGFPRLVALLQPLLLILPVPTPKEPLLSQFQRLFLYPLRTHQFFHEITSPFLALPDVSLQFALDFEEQGIYRSWPLFRDLPNQCPDHGGATDRPPKEVSGSLAELFKTFHGIRREGHTMIRELWSLARHRFSYTCHRLSYYLTEIWGCVRTRPNREQVCSDVTQCSHLSHC